MRELTASGADTCTARHECNAKEKEDKNDGAGNLLKMFRSYVSYFIGHSQGTVSLTGRARGTAHPHQCAAYSTKRDRYRRYTVGTGDWPVGKCEALDFIGLTGPDETCERARIKWLSPDQRAKRLWCSRNCSLSVAVLPVWVRGITRLDLSGRCLFGAL